MFAMHRSRRCIFTGANAKTLSIAAAAIYSPEAFHIATDLGLKTASFSQASKIIVASKQNNNIYARCWDLDYVTKEEKWENALVINTLIASSYRLKEWRIGNASGNSSKFKNDAKNERAEYFLSQNSFAAIDAILDAHNQIVKKNQYYDFAAFAMDKGAAIQLLVVIDKIKEMQDELKVLPKDDFTKANKLFNSAKDLHNAYYVSLIEQLSITGKILDADGD